MSPEGMAYAATAILTAGALTQVGQHLGNGTITAATRLRSLIVPRLRGPAVRNGNVDQAILANEILTLLTEDAELARSVRNVLRETDGDVASRSTVNVAAGGSIGKNVYIESAGDVTF